MCTDFSDELVIKLDGDLTGAPFTRKVKDWGDTFNIEFDLIVNKAPVNGCSTIVKLEHNDYVDNKHYPAINLCPNPSLAFEFYQTNKSHTVSRQHDIELNVEYHVEFKQYRPEGSNKLRRFAIIGNESIWDSEVLEPFVRVTEIDVRNLKQYADVSNLRIKK